MGRHAETAVGPLDLRRTAQAAGLVGGIAWVVAYFLPNDPRTAPATLLLWLGLLLLTVALFGLGLLLVKSDVLPLRVFVALALPTLVWGVFAIVRDSASDRPLVDAVFGAAVGLISGLQLVRRRSQTRATL
jgi:O-antigen/teichoic acid export membrane protein